LLSFCLRKFLPKQCEPRNARLLLSGFGFLFANTNQHGPVKDQQEKVTFYFNWQYGLDSILSLNRGITSFHSTVREALTFKIWSTSLYVKWPPPTSCNSYSLYIRTAILVITFLIAPCRKIM
jgi:hypothetical protein